MRSLFHALGLPEVGPCAAIVASVQSRLPPALPRFVRDSPQTRPPVPGTPPVTTRERRESWGVKADMLEGVLQRPWVDVGHPC